MPSSAPDTPRRAYMPTALVLLVTLGAVGVAAWLALGAVTGAGFFADDWQHLEAQIGRSPGQFAAWAFDVRQVHYFYRPVPRLLMYLQSMVFGLHPSGYHLTSLLLHIVNSVLWGILLWVVSGRRALLLAGALLFSVFPVYADAVLWISDSEILLALCFGLLALLLWARFVLSSSHLAYVGSLLCLALALLSKEAAVVVVPLMAGVHVALAAGAPYRETPRRWALLRFYALPLLILAMYLLIDLPVVQRGVPLLGGSYSLGAHALGNLGRYVALLATPLRTWTASGVAAIAWLGAMVVLVGCLLWRSRRLTLFLVFWTLCTLLPYVAFNDRVTPRYTYAAAMGWTGLWAFALCLLWEARGRLRLVWRSLAVAACALLMIMCIGDGRSRQAMLSASAHIQENILLHVRDVRPDMPRGSSLYFLNAPSAGRYLAAMFHVAWDSSLRVSGSDNSEVLEPAPGSPLYAYYYVDGNLRELVCPGLVQVGGAPPLPVQFGPVAALVGYDVLKPGSPGAPLLLLLYWRALAPTDRSYHVFSHLIDSSSRMWAQSDGLPQGGQAPTDAWQPRQFVADYRFLPLPPGAPPADGYRIEAGLYDLATMQRLRVVDAAGSPVDDKVVIGPVALP